MSQFFNEDEQGGHSEPPPQTRLQEPKEPLLQFFSFAHLPEKLQQVSKPFCDLAAHIVISLPRNSERTRSLEKLLEAKDCAVRAVLFE